MSIIRKQGGSYFADYSRRDKVSLDANWSGKWEIKDSDDNVVASGLATLAADNSALEFRIRSTDTVTLLGTYTMTLEVINTNLGFNKEIVDNIIFQEQNIT